jgi:uncharacterized protein (TIGR02246 family)
MATRRGILLTFSALVLAGCAPQVDLPAEEAAIRATAAHWAEMAAAGDATGVAALFAPDGTVHWEERQPASGTTAVQEFMERTFSLNPGGEESFAPDRIDIASSGDLAVEQGAWQGPGDNGRYMTVHKKIDGAWKIIADMSLSQAPSGGAPQWARDLLAGWYEDFNARNAARLASRHYTADAKVGAARGRAEIVALFEEGFGQAEQNCTGDFTDFHVVGGVAVASGVDVCQTTPAGGGETAIVYSNWVAVYEQQADGSWLCTRDIGEDVQG